VRGPDGGRGGRLERLPAVALGDGLRVRVAGTAAQRARGLARLRALPAGEALHLPRCRSVHTFGMRFALDLLWLDADGALVRVDRDVPPRRHRACRSARSVVECGAGHADRFAAAGVGHGYTAPR
jgi:uncharacterized protein